MIKHNSEFVLLESFQPFPQRTSSLFSALQTLFSFLNVNADFDYLLGISGRAFDLHIHPKGVFCEGPDECDITHFKRAIELNGYSSIDNITIFKEHPLNDSNTFNESIKTSIRNGLPALILEAFFPSWGLIIGYNKDGSFTVLGPNEKVEKKEFNEGPIIIISKSINQPNRDLIIRENFKYLIKQAYQETAKMFWSTPENPYMYCGLKAFDFWINHLEKNKNIEANEWCYVSLVDSRYSTIKYLETAELALDNEQQDKIKRLTQAFKQIHSLLSENLSTFKRKPNKQSVRNQQIDILKETRLSENKAYSIMKELIR
ncbi:MAG: hypothetical protein JXA16_13415 [Bacteroidales bacterium]|nr:hypothetical protein [Bacteroidales bacterium]